MTEQQQDRAFLQLAEKDATLEEALQLFFSGGGISDRTAKIRIYMLWYRYAKNKEVQTLTEWTKLYLCGLRVGKSLFLSSTQHTQYIRGLVSDFVAKKIDQKYHMGVGYAIYYLVSMLLMAEVFPDEIGERLLVKQSNVIPTMKQEEFIIVIEQVALYFSEYLTNFV